MNNNTANLQHTQKQLTEIGKARHKKTKRSSTPPARNVWENTQRLLLGIKSIRKSKGTGVDYSEYGKTTEK